MPHEYHLFDVHGLAPILDGLHKLELGQRGVAAELRPTGTTKSYNNTTSHFLTEWIIELPNKSKACTVRFFDNASKLAAHMATPENELNHILLKLG